MHCIITQIVYLEYIILNSTFSKATKGELLLPDHSVFATHSMLSN